MRPILVPTGTPSRTRNCRWYSEVTTKFHHCRRHSLVVIKTVKYLLFFQCFDTRGRVRHSVFLSEAGRSRPPGQAVGRPQAGLLAAMPIIPTLAIYTTLFGGYSVCLRTVVGEIDLCTSDQYVSKNTRIYYYSFIKVQYHNSFSERTCNTVYELRSDNERLNLQCIFDFLSTWPAGDSLNSELPIYQYTSSLHRGLQHQGVKLFKPAGAVLHANYILQDEFYIVQKQTKP